MVLYSNEVKGLSEETELIEVRCEIESDTSIYNTGSVSDFGCSKMKVTVFTGVSGAIAAIYMFVLYINGEQLNSIAI